MTVEMNLFIVIVAKEFCDWMKMKLRKLALKMLESTSVILAPFLIGVVVRSL